ncbi:hypothetical protein, partial [Leptospira interrogans]|uniref:hypothetical protein n=1 Tax=Leptospira interrogans TaxID=173 RepID=UPI001C6694C7
HILFPFLLKHGLITESQPFGGLGSKPTWDKESFLTFGQYISKSHTYFLSKKEFTFFPTSH